MVLGMSLATFTLFHVILSLIGIGAGVIVLAGMLYAKKLEAWTALFLVTTVATSVTGFLFPFKSFGPPHAVGIISLVVLALTLPALYVYRLVGRWRSIYVIGAVVSLYFNAFVGVVQAFQKIPVFNRLAPLGNEPPFAIAQALVLLLFLVLGWLAVKRFHPGVQPAVAVVQPAG
jgi:hypothetical protein